MCFVKRVYSKYFDYIDKRAKIYIFELDINGSFKFISYQERRREQA